MITLSTLRKLLRRSRGWGTNRDSHLIWTAGKKRYNIFQRTSGSCPWCSVRIPRDPRRWPPHGQKYESAPQQRETEFLLIHVDATVIRETNQTTVQKNSITKTSSSIFPIALKSLTMNASRYVDILLVGSNRVLLRISSPSIISTDSEKEKKTWMSEQLFSLLLYTHIHPDHGRDLDKLQQYIYIHIYIIKSVIRKGTHVNPAPNHNLIVC